MKLILASLFRIASIFTIIGLFSYPSCGQSLIVLRMPMTGLVIIPNATIEGKSLGILRNFSRLRFGYICDIRKISSKAEIGLFLQGAKTSPSQSPLESFGLGGKYKLNRTTAVGFSGFLGDTKGFWGVICHDLFLSPRWKGTLGLLYAKWKHPSGRGEDSLPFFGLLWQVSSRLKITFEWRLPFEGDRSPTYLSSLVVKIKENIRMGVGLGNLGRRDKAEIFFLASFGEGNIFSGW